MTSQHSPALAVHNLRNRIDATKKHPWATYLTAVDIPINDAETLLKERDGLLTILQAAIDAAAKGRNKDDPTRWMHPEDAALFRAASAALASATGQA